MGYRSHGLRLFAVPLATQHAHDDAVMRDTVGRASAEARLLGELEVLPDPERAVVADQVVKSSRRTLVVANR